MNGAVDLPMEFHTIPKHRVGGMVAVVLLGTGLLVAMPLIAWFTAWSPGGQTTVIGWVFGIGLALLGGRLAWPRIRPMGQLDLRVDADRMTVGRGILRQSIPRDAVQMIAHRTADGYRKTCLDWQYVYVVAPGVRWKGFLGDQTPAAFETLAALCPHAMLVGLDGNEIDRPSPPVPALLTWNRIRIHRWDAWLLLGVGTLFTAVAAGGLAVLIANWQLTVRFWVRLIQFLCMGVIGMTSLYVSIRLFARIRQLKNSLDTREGNDESPGAT